MFTTNSVSSLSEQYTYSYTLPSVKSALSFLHPASEYSTDEYDPIIKVIEPPGEL